VPSAIGLTTVPDQAGGDQTMSKAFAFAGGRLGY